MSESRCKMSTQRLVWQVFTIFCCPPLPSKIAAKLAFLPPEPSYYITDESTPKITWKESSAWLYTEKEKVFFEGFFAQTSRKNRIACIYVKCCEKPRYTLLYSHGNAVDLGQMSSFYLGLGMSINCNIFSYDYSGYGMSSGKPSEKNIYADIECAWNTLMSRYKVSPNGIILYGQSIGTVPTVDLASKAKPAAVVLHSALMSGLRLACPNTKRTLCCDAFPSIDKISKVTSPVLVIHGKEDDVIDFSHGKALYRRCRNPVMPLWVEHAGHNDIEIYRVYLERLLKFIYLDLPTIEKEQTQTPTGNETNERATETSVDEPSHDSSDRDHTARGSSNQFNDLTEPTLNENNKKSFQTYI